MRRWRGLGVTSRSYHFSRPAAAVLLRWSVAIDLSRAVS